MGHTMAFRLGEAVKHRFTPFEGVVIARTETLYGQDRCQVVSPELENGEPNYVWFDAVELESGGIVDGQAGFRENSDGA